MTNPEDKHKVEEWSILSGEYLKEITCLKEDLKEKNFSVCESREPLSE